MARPELEFHTPDGAWRRPDGAPEGVTEQTLSADPLTGDGTVLQRYAAGVDGSPADGSTGTITHDYWEEVLLVEGELTDVGLGATFTAGMYACRPPGMPHGPYRSAAGCLMLVTVRHG